MATLGEIETLTKEYAKASGSLADTVQKLEDAVEALKRQYIPAIERQVGIAAERKAALRTAIEDSRDLFKRPKTLIVHGWKVGYEKSKEEVTIEDEDLTVKLLKEKYPDEMHMYIRTKETVKRRAVKDLSELELKLIGVRVKQSEDVVVIKSTASEIRKYIDKLLKEKEQDSTEEEAA